MSGPPAHSDIRSSGKILELYPGSSASALGGARTARETLMAFLSAAGWSAGDLTTEQIRLLAGLMTERQKLLETIRDLSDELNSARDVADQDALLPLYNRRAFVRELGRQLSFCERHDVPATLIYMDLDHFKVLNDTLGHASGDQALLEFAKVLKRHTRQSDLIGRLGGDEFAILLLNASVEIGERKGEELRADVRALKFGDRAKPLQLDVSCGTIQWRSSESPEHLIERADEAMFVEKTRRQKSRA
ncbi:MAG: GGDEF domain-containing protein [Ponticaulis sp.]|nr:GGDEF domain-containing protein [Ponticaulis sp.]|tara:strand:- start:715 stop:1455 length:741 start_codon:yes stop_codon:yes gene_type:complete